MISYFNGDFVPAGEIHISPDDRGFLLADGIYEVVRFYRGVPFRLEQHRRRLEAGAAALRFERCEFPEFGPVMQRLVEENRLGDEASSTVYFQVTRGVAARSHAFPPAGTAATIYAAARPFSRLQNEIDDGVAAVTVRDDRWSRCDIKSIALLPNTLAHQAAREQGAVEAIFLRDGLVQEGSHSNVLCVKNGVVHTAPLTGSVLPGITRQVVLALCRDEGIPVREEDVPDSLFRDADEIAIVGTTVEVTPVVELDGKPVGAGEPGPLVRVMQERFFAKAGVRAGNLP